MTPAGMYYAYQAAPSRLRVIIGRPDDWSAADLRAARIERDYGIVLSRWYAVGPDPDREAEYLADEVDCFMATHDGS